MAETEGIADTADAVEHPSSALESLMVSQDAIEGMTAFAKSAAPSGRTADLAEIRAPRLPSAGRRCHRPPSAQGRWQRADPWSRTPPILNPTDGVQ
ncbi:hypothetical protein ABZ904_33950 [Streptomyces sp. NPDC046900]|uniref:hypothetical protein n=1 Tax=Streptomyces sp. NPDC046900 TaxID=3155473 RepID=UPI00340F7840